MEEFLDWTARIDNRWALAAFLMAVNLWALTLLWRADAGLRDRLLWSAVILLCPIVGCVLWYVLGPKGYPTAERGVGAAGGG